MHKEYYEGILQLRNPNSEILEYIKDCIGDKQGVSISKSVKLKNGIDFYISSQKFLIDFGKRLKSRFKGELKISRRIYSRSRLTSKNVYRINVFFKLIQLQKGDIMDYKGEKLMILGIKKKINAKNIKTGKKYLISFRDL